MEIIQTETYKNWAMNLKDRRALKKITARLLRISNGLLGDCRPVGDGVGEIRIHYGPGYRIYFKQKGDILIILLCGGNKTSQKNDIKQAKEIAKKVEVDKL